MKAYILFLSGLLLVLVSCTKEIDDLADSVTFTHCSGNSYEMFVETLLTPVNRQLFIAITIQTATADPDGDVFKVKNRQYLSCKGQEPRLIYEVSEQQFRFKSKGRSENVTYIYFPIPSPDKVDDPKNTFYKISLYCDPDPSTTKYEDGFDPVHQTIFPY